MDISLSTQSQLNDLGSKLKGEFHTDYLTKILYSTDASVYREKPLAVCVPYDQNDLVDIIKFAHNNTCPIIPRAAGTSLAGQCVGSGIVVDISKHFKEIIEFNEKEKWVKVQPGVVRDVLNHFLEKKGYFFSPITSTANRATIGGMVGNNSSGTTSIQYGTTRDHILEIDVILSDGTTATFKSISLQELQEKLLLKNLEGEIYRNIHSSLSDEKIKAEILAEFPKASIHRRNTGYALDALLASEPYSPTGKNLNLAELLCGSEGTLAFTTAIKIHVDPLPAPCVAVVAAHYNSIHDSLVATQLAMQHRPTACELMDKTILDCTLENAEQSKNRFFVQGDPQAILMVELRASSSSQLQEETDKLIEDLTANSPLYASPVIQGEETKKVWALRSAGLGLLANIPGDEKAVACIEDTAVDLSDLPSYIADFTKIMDSFGQRSVYYAHAGAGEIHLRPILNLKKSEDVQLFHDISLASAQLVKKYKGSLSGEHGDGRVRAAFIKLMVGEKNYALFRELKQCWDPQNIFNPGKIVDAGPMNEMLRYEQDKPDIEIKTQFDFSSNGGILRTAEKCNGSGDCRKPALSGGTMCPSYQATLDEKDTTRARANALREILTNSNSENKFDHEDLKEVMDLCISCKACSSECPSNVDMTLLKAEFQYQYYKSNKIPLRSKVFAHIDTFNKMGAFAPWLYNFFIGDNLVGRMNKKILGVSPLRNIPKLQKESLAAWYRQNIENLQPQFPVKKVHFFCDEFTNRLDTNIGIKAIKLLTRLQYQVVLIDHDESGRSAFSKGLLDKAKKHAENNVKIFSEQLQEEDVLIGIEPSAILSFRDEYPLIVDADLRQKSNKISLQCLLIDEFISKEIQLGNISSSSFHLDHKHIAFHGHCHQKSKSSSDHSLWLLSLPEHYTVEQIPSGCCGMAGSFGYEKEHFEISKKIAYTTLIPAIEKAKKSTIIAATGTSCRHQIEDFTERKTQHPIEILYDALI